jgi:hypothetical protein
MYLPTYSFPFAGQCLVSMYDSVKISYIPFVAIRISPAQRLVNKAPRASFLFLVATRASTCSSVEAGMRSTISEVSLSSITCAPNFASAEPTPLTSVCTSATAIKMSRNTLCVAPHNLLPILVTSRSIVSTRSAMKTV